MKSIQAVMLVWLTLMSAAGVARADRILVYNGAEITRQVQGGSPSVDHVYFLLDLDSYTSDVIDYNATSKTYSTGTNSKSAFNYGAVSQTGGRSQMVFSSAILLSNTNNHSLELAAVFLAGETSLLDLGGNFTGKVPKTLSISGNFLQTDGAAPGVTPDLIREVFSGSMKLVLPLTRTVNEADGSLDDAINAVQQYLTDHKYKPGDFD